MATDRSLDAGRAALDAPLARRAMTALIARDLAFDMADDVDDFEPPDEIVEGLMTSGALSVIYGDSNTGKTFVALDLACAVARGVEWMGRRVEQGLVVYLAAESPQSVRTRVYAYQREHKVVVEKLAIVTSPVNLFEDNADVEAIIAVVAKVEAVYKMKVRLIVGDTLARLAAGANENAGQDMGKVVRNVDRVREGTSAAFLLVHHCGKDAARGMRGWSGLRAAVDTEIEVTVDENGNRAAEITKQRDLPGKGDRIGFRLDRVELGISKWSKPVTSCVVAAADAPARVRRNSRTSEIAGAITELLMTRGSMRKTEVVDHFAGRYERGPIYREMKKLAINTVLLDVAGTVRMAVQP